MTSMQHVQGLSDADAQEHAQQNASTLDKLVSNTQSGRFDGGASDQPTPLTKVDDANIHTEEHKAKHPWLAKLVPSLENFATKEHLGNYVLTRGNDPQKMWESMPIYVRLGMHLLFCTGHKAVSSKWVEEKLREQSINQGKLFDAEEGAQEHIKSFIATYNLEDTLKELQEPDPTKYRTFNDFFSRQLKPGMRPVDSKDDNNVICSAADCRITVWNSLDAATKFWVKSREFTLKTLFQNDEIANMPEFKDGAALAIFRLAPADFHRWRSPVTGTMGSIKKIPGQYFTVNPQAVNEDFPVYTANRRDVVLIKSKSGSGTDLPVVVVAVGAMLVGSIAWTVQEGDTVEKGAEQGYFAYGGSTVLCVFPKGSVEFDEDLVKNSQNVVETQMRCGQHIGRFIV